MNKEFIPYEEALGLKKLGFDEECFTFNDNHGNSFDSKGVKNSTGFGCTTLPLYQQAFKWFREKYDLEGHIKSWEREGEIVYYYSVNKLGKPSKFNDVDFRGKTYEETELACLKKLIEIVKKK